MAIFTISLVFMLVVSLCDSNLPLLDHNKFAFTDLERVCYETFDSLLVAFADHDMEIGEDGITSKPAEVSSSSPCYGMPSTCCLAVEEKRMQPMVQMTYHKQLQSVLERRLSSCNKLGRSTERIVYSSLKQSRDLLEQAVASIIEKPEIPRDVFDRFFKFLYRFVHLPDFCQLSNEISIQLDTLFDYIMSLSTSSPLHSRADCYTDYKKHFTSVWYNDTLNTFVETLNVARILSEVFQLSEKLLKDLKQHKFSQECVNSLFRLKHCSFCVGNRLDITVCDGLCLNTFRGCMVDMYSLQPHFKTLQEQLHNMMLLANTEFRPEILAQKTMVGFKYMIKHMKHYMAATNQSMDSCSIVEDNTLLSQIVSEVASGLQPRVENTHLYSFKEASKYEMTCYNDIATAVTELDEEICNINPKHLRYMRNKGCWNGTHSKGSYNERIAGKSREDQLSNPTVRKAAGGDHAHNESSVYARQISQINGLISEINKTRQFYECLETDDEDCHMFVLECKRKTTTQSHDIDTGSSGSGSGSGSGHGSNDNESLQHSSTILIQLGGPRRFNEMMPTFDNNDDNNDDKGGSNATITDNDEDVKYSSNNNSSDESVIYDRSIPPPIPSTTTDSTPQITTTTEPSAKATPTTMVTPTTPLQKHQGSSTSSVIFSSNILVTIICLICIVAAML